MIGSANANIENARPKLKCRHVEVDATVYRLPRDASVLYFNNSFFGSVLETVLANVRVLAEAAPRPVLVVCNLPSHSPFEEQM